MNRVKFMSRSKASKGKNSDRKAGEVGPFQSFFSIGRKKKEKMDWVEPQSH